MKLHRILTDFSSENVVEKGILLENFVKSAQKILNERLDVRMRLTLPFPLSRNVRFFAESLLSLYPDVLYG